MRDYTRFLLRVKYMSSVERSTPAGRHRRRPCRRMRRRQERVGRAGSGGSAAAGGRPATRSPAVRFVLSSGILGVTGSYRPRLRRSDAAGGADRATGQELVLEVGNRPGLAAVQAFEQLPDPRGRLGV